MSSAALARKRRANGVPPGSSAMPQQPPSQQQQPGQPQPGQQRGMTMPQVIHLIDTRLKMLEDFKKEQDTLNTTTQTTLEKLPEEMNILKTNTANMLIHAKQAPTSSTDVTNGIGLEEYTQFTQEYETRFNTMVTEINDLKDMLIKLQGFTMDVNKKLLEEHLARAKELREAEQAIRQYNETASHTVDTTPSFNMSTIPEEPIEQSYDPIDTADISLTENTESDITEENIQMSVAEHESSVTFA